MSALPSPMVPGNVDLTDFQFMPLDVVRLRDSGIAVTVTGEEFRCAVLLWCASWHQVPAASLPDDDIRLSSLAGFGRAVSTWREHRAGSLHGWVKCSDGRLYHPVVAEKAIEAWNSKRMHRWRKECDRIRKENKAREEKGQHQLELPLRPAEIYVITGGSDTGDGQPSGGTDRFGDLPNDPLPPEAPNLSGGNGALSEDASAGIPAENALKGQGQGQGQGKIEDDCPKPAARLRTRPRYPEDFERFWADYPTDANMSKQEAGKAWGKLTEDDRASAIAAIPGFVAHCHKDPTYRPLHAVRFLTQRRFDGFLEEPGLKANGHARVDFGGGISAPEETVVDVLKQGKWLPDWGPRMGEPGCKVPERLWRAAQGAMA